MRREDLRALALLFGRFALPHWVGMLGLMAVSLATALSASLQPLVLAPALDVALLSHTEPAASLDKVDLNNLGPTIVARLGFGSLEPFQILLMVVLLFMSLTVLSAALGFWSLQLMRSVRTDVAKDMQAEMFRHTLGLSMPFFVKRRVGDLAHCLVFDVISNAQSFDPIIRGVLQSGTQIAIYGAVLLRTDSRLASVVAVVAVLHVLITRVLQNRIRRSAKDSFGAYGRLAATIQDSLQGIRVIKSFSAERFEHQRIGAQLDDMKRIVLRFGMYANIEGPLRQIADGFALGAALIASFLALSSGRLTLAGFGLFILVVRQMIPPLTNFGSAFLQIHRFLGTSHRIIEVLDSRPTVVDGPRDAGPLTTGIKLEQVFFEYEPGQPVLRGVDLDIPKGKVIALVGPSGAGKSTLADLVLRFQDPTAGRVTWDGIDVKEFRQASYRQHFGVVSQESLLFNATLEENIAYSRPLVKEEVVRAAQTAHADEFIDRFPDGYQTFVGDRGIRLSGGQRQRISLARALYARPEVLILDEATSSLDSESERMVQEAIDAVLRNATAVVIAHRLSTVRRADQIMVIEGGRVEARGTHAELLETSPLYRRLCAAQFQDEPVAATP